MSDKQAKTSGDVMVALVRCCSCKNFKPSMHSPNGMGTCLAKANRGHWSLEKRRDDKMVYAYRYKGPPIWPRIWRRCKSFQNKRD